MNEPVAGGSTVPRRQVGRHLRELRDRTGMSVRTAAVELEWSPAKLSRIENGEISVRSLDVEQMCRIYGVDDEGLVQTLMALARETKAKGWWHSFSDVVSPGFSVYLGLEEAASEIVWYVTDVLPGLLQTEAYARNRIEAAATDPLTPEALDRFVKVRLARKPLLTRSGSPLTVKAVLDEALLRRPVGGQNTMAEQLGHLLEMSDLPNVEIKVMPHAVGNHRGLATGSFEILRFPQRNGRLSSEPPTVYVEGYTGDLYLDKPDEVARYDAAWADIWSAALDGDGSREFIKTARKDLE